MPVHYNANDAIEGKRIACQFRRISKKRHTTGSSRHRAQQVTLDDGYCVIVVPITKV